MHRPLRVPLLHRVWHLVRGLLFYNTVYWKKASDGLKMPSLSAAERERQRPVANLEVIRPRVNPRARLEDEPRRERRSKGKEIRLGSSAKAEAETPEAAEPPGAESADAVRLAGRGRQLREDTDSPEAEDAGLSQGEVSEPELTYVKRKRYRRRYFGRD